MYLYGAGGHCNVVREVLKSNGIAIDGLFDDDETKHEFKGHQVDKGIQLNGHKLLMPLPTPLIICIGNNASRAMIDKKLNALYGQAIHRSAIIADDVVIGDGTVVLQGAIIQTGSKIGRHALINTCASVDHDNVIGNYVHISPKATLCGHVEVGEGTQIGAGAVVIPKVKIGKWCVIGAGTIVLKDIPDYSIAVGNPAHILPAKSEAYKRCQLFNSQ